MFNTKYSKNKCVADLIRSFSWLYILNKTRWLWLLTLNPQILFVTVELNFSQVRFFPLFSLTKLAASWLCIYSKTHTQSVLCGQSVFY